MQTVITILNGTKKTAFNPIGASAPFPGKFTMKTVSVKKNFQDIHQHNYPSRVIIHQHSYRVSIEKIWEEGDHFNYSHWGYAADCFDAIETLSIEFPNLSLNTIKINRYT